MTKADCSASAAEGVCQVESKASGFYDSEARRVT